MELHMKVYNPGDLVAFNDLEDATWFTVIAQNGLTLEVKEGEGYASQFSDYSLVRQCKPKGASKSVWLVVANMAWGRGPTLKAAFVNCMENVSSVDRVSKLAIRRYTPNAAHAEMSDDDFAKLVYVDGMGNGVIPAGATVHKLDIPLTNHLAKATRAFNEAWDEFTCTEAMDEAFDGDLTEGGR